MGRAHLLAVFFTLLLAIPAQADQGPLSLQVLPWNGFPAAFSLTFDDGDPSHLDVAVPELDQRGLKGTFFLIANQVQREEEWRKLPASGHEIANHTLDHKHAGELDKEGEKSQVAGAKAVLQKKFGVQVHTFAYPFVEITPGLKEWCQKTHLLARGGGGSDPVMVPSLEPDWMNVPSRTTRTALEPAVYDQWMDEGLKRGGWTVLMIHGLEGTTYGWEPITRVNFNHILDGLKERKVWVGTFRDVGAYYRAQRILEAVVPSGQGGRMTWNWKVPEGFPQGTKLKVKVPSAEGVALELRQGEKVLLPTAEGVYEVLFNKGEFRALPRPDEKASTK